MSTTRLSKAFLVTYRPQCTNSYSLLTRFTKIQRATNSKSRAQEAREHFYSQQSQRNKTMMYYTMAVIIGGVGVTYAAVPLYRAFCSATGYDGTPMTDPSKFTPDRLVPISGSRKIRITFNADVSDSLPWSFKPQQRQVHVVPGETALAFYVAKNRSNSDIIGIATYNVTPEKAAQYFNKVQCFCFDEQKLLAGEEVDMPVFFFLDPDMAKDPWMNDVDTITLSYTFFKAKYDDNGTLMPVPGSPQS